MKANAVKIGEHVSKMRRVEEEILNRVRDDSYISPRREYLFDAWEDLIECLHNLENEKCGSL